MSKKKAAKKGKSTKKVPKELPPLKFKAGQLVQVNDGVLCADFESLPLGGWVGKVTEARYYRGKPVYDLAWTKETLAAAHPIYAILSDEHDLREDEYYGLREDELQPYEGAPLCLADPGDISRFQNRPLSPKSEKDRLRMVFGLKPLDPIPEVDSDSLRQYWRYLTQNITLPFKAYYVDQSGWDNKKIPFTCEKLDDPKDEGDEHYGLFCRGKRQNGSRLICPLNDVDPVGLPKEQKQILDDYCQWTYQ